MNDNERQQQLEEVKQAANVNVVSGRNSRARDAGRRHLSGAAKKQKKKERELASEQKVLGDDFNSDLAQNAGEANQPDFAVDPRASRFNLGWIKEWFEQIETLPTALIRDMASSIAKQEVNAMSNN